MKKMKVNLLLTVGFVLFSIARIAIYNVGEQNNLLHAFNGFAIGLVLAGAVLQVLMYHGVSDNLRQWKLRLIGKEPK
jgi:phosphatidylserine synthase